MLTAYLYVICSMLRNALSTWSEIPLFGFRLQLEALLEIKTEPITSEQQKEDLFRCLYEVNWDANLAS